MNFQSLSSRIYICLLLTFVLPICPVMARTYEPVESQPLSQEETVQLEQVYDAEIEEVIVGDEVIHHYHNNSGEDAAAVALVVFIFVLLLLAAAAGA